MREQGKGAGYLAAREAIDGGRATGAGARRGLRGDRTGAVTAAPDSPVRGPGGDPHRDREGATSTTAEGAAERPAPIGRTGVRGSVPAPLPEAASRREPKVKRKRPERSWFPPLGIP